MTEKTQPTDAEIDRMVAAYLGDCGPQATRVYSFTRAVLAKWGQPAQAADSVTAPAAVVIECGNLYAKVKLTDEAFGTTKVGDKLYRTQAAESVKVMGLEKAP